MKVTYDIAFIAALLGVLLVGMLVSMRGPMKAREHFYEAATIETDDMDERRARYARLYADELEELKQRQDPLHMYDSSPLAQYKGLVGMSAGRPACMDVASPISAHDEEKNKTRTCIEVCNARTDGMVASMGATTSHQNNYVTCKCCHPMSRVMLEEHAIGSEPCVPDVMGQAGSYSVRDGKVLVRNGCKGIFSWMDGSLIRCDSNGQETSCPYLNSSVTLRDLQARPRDTRHALALQAQQLDKDHTVTELRRMQDETLINNIATKVDAHVKNSENLWKDAPVLSWKREMLPRQLSFYNIPANGANGNTNKWYDYQVLFDKYGTETPFYIAYNNNIFKIKFNESENTQIRNTSFWSYKEGSGWRSVMPEGALPVSTNHGSPTNVTEISPGIVD
jgi:hypothetical protein